jgi:uncharacterized protein (DUF1501 family)
MKRRSFLKGAAGVAAGAAGIAAAPFVLGGQQVRASSTLNMLAQLNSVESDKILIIVQLFGGNDGLNTMIPALDDNYHRMRPDIRVDPKDCFNLANIYLHPSLNAGNKGGLARMLEVGTLAIVQGVGYDNPNLSHFRSTDIWLSGINSSDPDVRLDTGWLGRMLEKQYPDFPGSLPNDPLAIQFGGFSLALMSSKGRMGIEVGDPSKQEGVRSELDTLDDESTDTRYKIEYEFISDIASRSNKYAENVKNAYAAGKTKLKGNYGSNGFAKQMASVAALIAGGLQTKVYVVSLGGFDTHVSQQQLDPRAGSHPALLSTLSDAIGQFQYDMTQLEQDDRVIGMTVSEFGRRPEQNGSFGTDHGAASVQFVWGSQVNSGVYGTAPDLVNLNANGDLVYSVDYRSIYAEVLTDWFGMTLPEAREVLVKDDVIPVDVLRKQASSVKDVPSVMGRVVTNYPNPFVGQTTLAFDLEQPEDVMIQVSDVAGKCVQQILSQRLAAGPQRIPVVVDGSGVYICTVRIGASTYTHIMHAR